MRRVVELDKDMLVARAVNRPPRPEHQPELRPILDRARPLGEGHRCPMHSHHPASAIHEFHQALPQRRIGEEVADRVVEEHGVELAQALRPEHLGITANHRVERPGLLAHQLEREIRRRDGGMAAVVHVPIEDEQLAGLARSGEGARGKGRFDQLTLVAGGRDLRRPDGRGAAGERESAGGGARKESAAC